MTDTHYRVQVEGDHIKKLISGNPIQSLAELIWNGLDADSSRIDVEIDSDQVAMRTITIRDNGHGIPHSDVKEMFGKLGGSWKAHGNLSKNKKRILHGKEGKGREYPKLCVWGLAHAIETGHLLNRSGYRIANWFLAATHSLTQRPFFSNLRIAR